MTTTSDTPRIHGKRGRRTESHEPRLDINLFLRRAEGTDRPAVEVWPAWDGSHGWTSWDMDGNDSLGDCGAAAIDHALAAAAGNAALLGTMGGAVSVAQYATLSPVIGAYYAYGVSQGETGTPPAPADEPDQGVSNSTWLAWLYANGYIDGYAEVPFADVGYYASIFGGALIGVLLSDDAEAEFEAGTPWGAPGDTPDPNNGHDICVIATSPDGSGKVVTWGALQAFTPEFIAANAAAGGDAWVIISKDDPNVDQAALQAALTAIAGEVGGFPVSPPANGTGPTTPPHEGIVADLEADLHHAIDEAIDILRHMAPELTADEIRTAISDLMPTILRGIGHAIAGSLRRL